MKRLLYVATLTTVAVLVALIATASLGVKPLESSGLAQVYALSSVPSGLVKAVSESQYTFVSWVDTGIKTDVKRVADVAKRGGWSVVELEKDFVVLEKGFYTLPNLMPKVSGSPRINVECKVFANGTILCYALLDSKTLGLAIYLDTESRAAYIVTDYAVKTLLTLLGPSYAKFASSVRSGIAGRSDVKYLVAVWTDYTWRHYVAGYVEFSKSVSIVASGYLVAVRSWWSSDRAYLYIDGRYVGVASPQFYYRGDHYGYSLGSISPKTLEPGVRHGIVAYARYYYAFALIVVLLRG